MIRFCTFFLLLAVFTSPSFAQERRDPKAMYDRIKYLDYKRDEALRDEKDSGKAVSMGFFCTTDDCKEATDLASELDKRGETEPVAAFYAGLRNLEFAQRANVHGLTKWVESSSKDARRRFVAASTAGIAAASWNMGVIYATNLGVVGSNLAAIEWYARAGLQYLNHGERETALAALEKVEGMDAKHPDSTRLRAALFPVPSKK
jgi:hypothetical protein